MDYLMEQYKAKLTTAEEAVKVVKDGDWVDFGFGVNTPEALDKALAARAWEVWDVNIRGGISLSEPAVTGPSCVGHFTWNPWHCSGIDRKVIGTGGMGFFAPIRYADLPKYYKNNEIHVNVAMLMTGPMDGDGYFSFTLTTSHLDAVCRNADIVIVEVNRNMPHAFSKEGSKVHIDDVKYIVEHDSPLRTLAAAPSTEIDNKIADLIVNEIPNGACLQLGIGAMPNAIGQKIADSDLKDLGVHTEMYVDAFVEMTEKGRITGKFKNLDRRHQVYAFAAGSQKMYDFLNGNTEVLGAPVDYTNDPAVVAQIDKFYSINNAIDIDLFGQFNAESAGTKQISGTGGQLDFAIGAYQSNGGKSFIAMTSTYTNKDGGIESRIRPTLAVGSVVTTPRSVTQYVVTEYGMFNCKGKSLWQRAEGLIDLAHPDFREDLIKEADKMGVWRRVHKRF